VNGIYVSDGYTCEVDGTQQPEHIETYGEIAVACRKIRK
jgi:hypothetical protein